MTLFSSTQRGSDPYWHISQYERSSHSSLNRSRDHSAFEMQERKPGASSFPIHPERSGISLAVSWVRRPAGALGAGVAHRRACPSLSDGPARVPAQELPPPLVEIA